MSDTERLSKRVASLAGCSRREAEQYIEGGWVTVDGVVVDEPQYRVAGEHIDIDPAARLRAREPATLLFHKPAGLDLSMLSGDVGALLDMDKRWEADSSGIRRLKHHLQRLTPLMPIDAEASGLVVLSQDGRVWRRLSEDADAIEQEYVVEVGGEIAPYGLSRLNCGLNWRGRALPPCKVSWQNEIRLRFAIKAVQPGQLRHMCGQVGLDVVAIRRIRIGKVPLGKMPVGEWRYLPAAERF